MDDQPDQQSDRVDDDVALAAHDLVASIKAPYSGAFGRFHARAVNDIGGRTCLLASLLARRHHEFIIDRAQQTFVAPAVEIFLHRRERWEVLR